MNDIKWIEELNAENKSLILLYGNIHDCFMYQNNLLQIEEIISGKFPNLKIFFDLNSLSNNDSPHGFEREDGINIVKQIYDYVREDNHNILISSPSLFFTDTTSALSNNFYSPSIHYLSKVINKIESSSKVIFLSPQLESYPVQLYINNPDVAVIKVDKPTLEQRREYIKMIFSISDNDTLSLYSKITNGRSLNEISEIFDKANCNNIDLKYPAKVLSFYDFGDIESPWTKLDKEDIKNIDVTLKSRVFGQDLAISHVKKVLVRAKLGLSDAHQIGERAKPIGNLFFVGPSGVGKTELAKAITHAIFGKEDAFKRFDMSEYKESGAINKLIGSAPGYVGFEQGGELTNWVRENPFSVILFDEIEKANPLIWDTFLQILEDGRLTDNKGKTVYFKESILIFTSNIGSSNPDLGYINAVEEYFIKTLGRVEILNRFGNNIIEFNAINSNEVFSQIIKSKLNITLENIFNNLKCKVIVDDVESVVNFIISKIDREKFGGRAVNNIFETFIINEFGIFYIENNPEVVRLFIADEKIEFSC